MGGFRAPIQLVTLYTLLGALVLASVHLLSGRLTFLQAIPRSRWLSVAGGVSVSYVFLHLLPELQDRQLALEEQLVPIALEHHLYIVALAGLVIFYGLEKMVRKDEARGRQKGDHSLHVFWLHVISFSLYNGLIGYLLVREKQQETLGLFLFVVALALHFLVNDHALRHEHRDAYHRRARWLLALAVLGGWTLGIVTVLGERYIAALFAFLTGGIVLNVLKEELPEERRSRFWAFAAGAVGYALLVSAI